MASKRDISHEFLDFYLQTIGNCNQFKSDVSELDDESSHMFKIVSIVKLMSHEQLTLCQRITIR